MKRANESSKTKEIVKEEQQRPAKKQTLRHPNSARLVPFDPALSYWLIIHVCYDGGDREYFLFNPASVTDSTDLKNVERYLDSINPLSEEPSSPLYKNPEEYLEELEDPKSANTNFLRGEFCKMPPEGTTMKITRVLTGMDIDY
jgi:hypothetical protein